jgi:hypothetical protein
LNVFSSLAEESFYYLINEYGFTKSDAIDGNWKTTFLYEKSKIGIEIELNYKDMDAFVYIFLLEEDKQDPYDKIYLEDLLGIKRIPSNGNQTTIEQFEKNILQKSNLLKQSLENFTFENEVIQ